MNNSSLEAERSHNFIKNLLIGAVGLACIVAFVTWPDAWVAVIGVVTVIILAYVSEQRSSTAAVRCKGLSVLITGCDTGTYAK